MSEIVLVLYVPVLHQGYIELFKRAHRRGIRRLIMPDLKLAKELSFLEPEIRALKPEVMRELIVTLAYFESVSVMGPASYVELPADVTILSADEGFSRRMVERFWPGQVVEYDTVFLRWDEANVLSLAPAGYDRTSDGDFDREMMGLAESQTAMVGDWWRQVGGVIVRAWQPILVGSNQHVPSQHTPYVNGDPRDHVMAGTQSELATTLHCEMALITEAARTGVSLQGASLYVTVFPCPVCAKLIAYAGIKRVYFRTGHASLDGQTILETKGVELILVP